MKTTSALVILVAVATSIGQLTGQSKTAAEAGPETTSLQKQIVAKELEELDCLKLGDLEVFAQLLADDAVFVDAHGPASKAEVVKNTAAFRLQEYSMEDVRFVPLSDKSGLVTYKISEKGTSHGKDFVAQVYVSAIWAEREGKWLCLFSQETAAR